MSPNTLVEGEGASSLAPGEPAHGASRHPSRGRRAPLGAAPGGNAGWAHRPRARPGAAGPTRVSHGAWATPGTDVPIFRAPDRRAGAVCGSVIRRPAGTLPQANVTAPA